MNGDFTRRIKGSTKNKGLTHICVFISMLNEIIWFCRYRKELINSALKVHCQTRDLNDNLRDFGINYERAYVGAAKKL